LNYLQILWDPLRFWRIIAGFSAGGSGAGSGQNITDPPTDFGLTFGKELRKSFKNI
jgi:hypothetical protein